MILATPLNSSLVQSKAIAAPDATLANLPHRAGAGKSSGFSKALAAASSASAAKRPEKAKTERAAPAAVTNSSGPATVPVSAVVVNSIGLGNAASLTGAASAAAKDFPDDPAVTVVAGSSSNGAAASGSYAAGASSATSGALTNLPSTNTGAANFPTVNAASLADSAANIFARTTGVARFAAESQAKLPPGGAGSGALAGESSSGREGKNPVHAAEAAKAGGPFEVVNSLAARIANPVTLKTATAALESYAALARPGAKASTPATDRGPERTDGNAERSAAAQREANPGNAGAASANGVSANTPAQSSIESQRAISDVRQSLVGQLESKLQSEVNASAPQTANGINAIDGKDAAQAGGEGQQGGAQTGASGNGEQKRNDSQSGGTVEGDALGGP